MATLFCGHIVADALYAKMYQAKDVACPKCGMHWRGYQVIMRDKGQARRDLFHELRRAAEKTKEHFKK